VLKGSDYVTLHVPLLDSTRNMVSAARIETMKQGAILLNFARDGLVDDAAVAAALEAGRLRYYMCDFPAVSLQGNPRVIALPHLGASTREAEDNCAVMVVDQLRNFLEEGNIANSVNFPDALLTREAPYRVAIANANVPNMLGQISTAMAKAGLNIHDMLNKSKGEMAYTLVDVDSSVPRELLDELARIKGVLSVRYLPQQ
jgi:D-3-phosphoglycerate dehydrogenase